MFKIHPGKARNGHLPIILKLQNHTIHQPNPALSCNFVRSKCHLKSAHESARNWDSCEIARIPGKVVPVLFFSYPSPNGWIQSKLSKPEKASVFQPWQRIVPSGWQHNVIPKIPMRSWIKATWHQAGPIPEAQEHSVFAPKLDWTLFGALHPSIAAIEATCEEK